MSNVTAIHLYVTDLDRAVDFYSRLLGYGPQAAYDEGENAHSAFFVLEQRTYLVLTWDPDRGREVGGSTRLELAADDLEQEVERLRKRGVDGGAIVRNPLRDRRVRPGRPGRASDPHRSRVDAPRDRGRGLIARPGSPFLIVNPRSGDDEPSAEELVAEAERRGIDTHMLGATTMSPRSPASVPTRALPRSGWPGETGRSRPWPARRSSTTCPSCASRSGPGTTLPETSASTATIRSSVLDAFRGGEERRVDVG